MLEDAILHLLHHSDAMCIEAGIEAFTWWNNYPERFQSGDGTPDENGNYAAAYVWYYLGVGHEDAVTIEPVFFTHWAHLAAQILAHEFKGHIIDDIPPWDQIIHSEENQKDYMCQCGDPRPDECNPFDPYGPHQPV